MNTIEHSLANRFKVNDQFIKGLAPDGIQVYINLSEGHTWITHKQIYRIISQLTKELSTYFPFLDKGSQQQQNYYGGQSSSNYYQQYQQQPGAGYQQQPQGYQQPSGNYQQYQQPPYVQPGNNQSNSNQYNNNYNPQQQGGAGYQSGANYQGNQYQNSDLDGQLKQQCLNILESKASELTKEIKKQKQLSLNLIETYQKQEILRRQQNVKENEIQSTLTEMKEWNSQMEQFLDQNGDTVLSKDTIDIYLVEQDPLSTQIIEIAAEIQAYKETYHYIVQLFKKNQLDIELIKTVILSVVQQIKECEIVS